MPARSEVIVRRGYEASTAGARSGTGWMRALRPHAVRTRPSGPATCAVRQVADVELTDDLHSKDVPDLPQGPDHLGESSDDERGGDVHGLVDMPRPGLISGPAR